MNEDQIIEEVGVEIAIERIIPLISEEINKYKKTRDKESSKKLAELLEDRKKIYAYDKDTIRKYIKFNGGI